MNRSGHDDLSNLSMLELFRVEAEGQTAALTAGLLELERGSNVSVVKGQGCGEPDPSSPDPANAARFATLLESLMRAAHSIKGAARIVNLGGAVRVAHAMEDCFVAAQQGRLQIRQPQIDTLLRGVDLLLQISKSGEVPSPQSGPGTGDSGLWTGARAAEIEQFVGAARALGHGQGVNAPASVSSQSTVPSPQSTVHSPQSGPGTWDSGLGTGVAARSDRPERVVRLNADNLNRLLGLAGEALVESRWLRPFSDSMQRLKRLHADLQVSLDALSMRFNLQVEGSKLQVESQSTVHSPQSTVHNPQSGLGTGDSGLGTGVADENLSLISLALQQAAATRDFLARRLEELDVYDRRSAHLSNRLYLEVLRSRMRPFAEGAQRFPRMVRDLARSLDKLARLDLVGAQTQVDRDILEKLETPLAHLLRNAVDHGCETPAERRAAGKPAEGLIVLEARHSAGLLLVTVADDGRGVDTQRVRDLIVARGLTSAAVAERMGEGELLEFLFLPGFSLKDSVTELSGRGVGLDVVQNLVKSLRGTVRVATEAGRGMKFQLQLPLTLSVLRTLLVEIGGEPYAFPLGHISQTLMLERARIESLAGRPHFALGELRVGLLAAQAVLGIVPLAGVSGRRSNVQRLASGFGRGASDWGLMGDLRREASDFSREAADLAVVVLGERHGRFGLVVDRFLGERELVVQPLDARLGKVQDVSAAALLEDGSPVLIVDVDDLLGSIEKLIASGAVDVSLKSNVQDLKSGFRLQSSVLGLAPPLALKKRKRVLAVDDSLTVRELERKLLTSRGYLADVARDGMDGWNAVRSGVYDLVITDVDMPRMDGIELARLIKQDARLKSLPVMIVSYKDREEDRMRGLEAGADYYLTKGSFHDETLLQAVLDLIGEPVG